MFGPGGDLLSEVDLRRFVKWPKYVRVQRQRRLLYQSIKKPSVISQFSGTLDKNRDHGLFCLLNRYKNESKTPLRARRRQESEIRVSGKKIASIRRKSLSFGINNVTRLVETKKAALVVIAHDVEPIEIVLWLPSLCNKKNVPYLIVKGRSRLGKIAHRKKVSCIAIEGVNQDFSGELGRMVGFATQCQTISDAHLEETDKSSIITQPGPRSKQNLIPGII